MKSVSNFNFAQVPPPQIQRSVFNRSRGYKTTFNEGDLIPIFLDEVLPGDTMSLTCQLFGRLASLLFPIMDNVYLDMFFFYCPNRLLWNHWEQFQGAQANPGDTTDYEIPILAPAEGAYVNFDLGTLGDYFGLPTNDNIAPDVTPINVLPFRMYNFVWNQWFRDENLQNSVPFIPDDGPEYESHFTILKRGKRHDYITSCLPWPQKGDAVSIPIGTSAPVVGTGYTLGLIDGTDRMGILTDNAQPGLVGYSKSSAGAVVGSSWTGSPTSTSKVIGVDTNPAYSGLIADLSSATAATINQLREAFAFQKVYERDARGGTRYTEILNAHWGVTVPDFRLQRPEYLGGYSQRMSINQVPQTSESGTTPQANLAAYGMVSSRAGFHRSFVEHGYVMGLVNVRADLSYQQQVHRMWSRRTRFDFYMPALAHLGEQGVLNQEVHYGSELSPELVFGYQERWAEYRYGNTMVTNLFRSNNYIPGGTGSLDAWHLALNFGDDPTPLNATFIQDNAPLERTVAVPSEPRVILDSYFDIKHARPMPVYSVPGQLDRF